jgi:hypothetical protein
MKELENTLPDGFHDAELQKVSVNYQERTMTLDLFVWIGNVGDSSERRETYRMARLELSGLSFLVMEPPDPAYPFKDSAGLTIDGCDLSKNLNAALLKSLPDGVFVRSLWVNEWNAFMHIAARDVEIFWQGEAVNRGRRELRANS